MNKYSSVKKFFWMSSLNLNLSWCNSRPFPLVLSKGLSLTSFVVIHYRGETSSFQRYLLLSFQAGTLIKCRNPREWMQNRCSKYPMSSSAASHAFGNCLPRLVSKIFFPQFSSLLQNTGWGQFCRSSLGAGSLLSEVQQHNCTACPGAVETSVRQMSGQAWQKWGYHWSGIFTDSCNEFSFSIFSGDGHDIFLKISNARRGFCPFVIINLK